MISPGLLLGALRITVVASNLINKKLSGVVRERALQLLSLRPHDKKGIDEWADGLYLAIQKKKEGKIK